MRAWRVPRWALPAALGGVLAILAADAVLMRRRPVTRRPPPIAATIGLQADAEGAGLRVQWDRGSRPVHNADHAILYIVDGMKQSQLDLTRKQLVDSSVIYWPESGLVKFRLEVYRGTESSSDSAVYRLPEDRNRGRPAGPARAIVEPLRPSPFERVEPEIVEVQMLPAPLPAEPERVAAAALPPREGGLQRVISKIPLLRRLKKHPQSIENEPR